MATTVRITNRVSLFKRLMGSAVKDGGIRAARKLRTFARRKVNRKYAKRSGEKTGASKPGEPPKRRTGRGYYSIDAVKLRGQAGVAKTFSSKRKAPYMAMYEHGPASVQRPWMEPALRENKSELFKIMNTPAKRRLRRGR